MNFVSPVFFWALVSLLPLIAIYLLKVKPTLKPTTAFFLWEDIFQEKKATSLFQRFRDLLSLLMMMLAFLAIVFALVRPDLSGDNQKDLVLLIDNSASMNAIDGGSSRLEQAKTVARQIVRGLNGTQRCSVATVSNESAFLSNLTDNPRELLDAIASIQPGLLTSEIDVLQQFRKRDSQEDGAAELESEESSVTDRLSLDSHRVILISDGCLGAPVPEELELIKVGTSNPGNVGIVACDMLRLPGGRNRVGVFFQINSTFDKQVSAEILLSHGTQDNLVKLIPLELVPGENPAEVFELEDTPEGKWFLQLQIADETDALADDDQAFMVLPPRRPIPIAVVAEDRFFYENSVLAFSRNDGLLTLVPQQEKPSPQLLIGAGIFAVADDSTSDLLVFQPQGESVWWSQVGEEIEVALPRTLNENHPVVRHLDPTLIPFVGARRLTAPQGAEVWVEAEDGTPLIYRATNAGRSAIIVNLDPLASDFYFSAWFPVLVYSSAVHLAGRSEVVSASYPTGHFARIPGVQSGQKTTVTRPDETQYETTETFLSSLSQAGFYQLNSSGGDWQFASSLLSTTETQIDNSEVEASSQPVNRGFSPAIWLTILAILVVVAESILYQRRKVG